MQSMNFNEMYHLTLKSLKLYHKDNKANCPDKKCTNRIV